MTDVPITMSGQSGTLKGDDTIGIFPSVKINISKNEEKEDSHQTPDQSIEAVDIIVVNTNEKVNIKRRSRCLFFFFILTINLCVNLENGTIPAITTKIQEDLNVGEDVLGLFGSLLYVGNIIGKNIK